MTRVLPLLLLAGCGVLDPEVGEDLAPGAADAATGVCDLDDSDPGTEVTFTDVRDQLFRPRCSCHTIAGGLGQVVGGLDLDDYDAMREGGRNGGSRVVVEGKPCESVIIMKTGDSPPFGAQMPLSGVALSVEARQLLVDWIADGAKE